MIVRISTEGQYQLDGDEVAELDKLDRAAIDALEAGDEPRFRAAFAELLEFVRAHGHTVESDHLGASDLILPPPDVTLEEARVGFSAEGLLPD
jgi:hypothetical protein